MEEKKKSKYLRDKDEPKKSKYIRSGDEPKKSIYENDGEKKYKSGRERYEAYLEHDREVFEALKKEETPQELAEEVPEIAEEPVENEGDAAADEAVSSIFKDGKKRRKGNITSGNRDHKATQTRVFARMVSCCIMLEIIAVILQVFRFRVPFTPLPLKMDMSAIPELLAAIAYGPLVGIAITLFKNLIFIGIFQGRVLATAISNTILDSLFVISASLIYTRGMFSPQKLQKRREKENVSKNKRMKQIIKSGLIGAVITTPLSYFPVNYIVYPLLFKQYSSIGHTYEKYLEYYQNALNTLITYASRVVPVHPITLKSLAQGTLIFNLPLTFIKLVIVTFVVAFIYRGLSNFLHYRNKK